MELPLSFIRYNKVDVTSEVRSARRSLAQSSIRLFIKLFPNKFTWLSYQGCTYLKQFDTKNYIKRMKRINEAVWAIQEKFWYPIWGRKRQIEEGLDLLSKVNNHYKARERIAKNEL